MAEDHEYGNVDIGIANSAFPSLTKVRNSDPTAT